MEDLKLSTNEIEQFNSFTNEEFGRIVKDTLFYLLTGKEPTYDDRAMKNMFLQFRRSCEHNSQTNTKLFRFKEGYDIIAIQEPDGSTSFWKKEGDNLKKVDETPYEWASPEFIKDFNDVHMQLLLKHLKQ